MLREILLPILTVLILIIGKKYNKKLNIFHFKLPKNIREHISFIILPISLIFVLYIIILLSGIKLEKITTTNLFFDLIIHCFLPAFGEEFFTRGILLGAVIDLYKQHFGKPSKNLLLILSVINALFFMILHHDLNLIWDPIRLITGIIFISVFLSNNNNLLPPLLAHFVNNFVSVILSYT